MIKIDDLCKHYDTLKVLDHLNLEVLPGETLVILGRSGVGKSVLLKHIIGIIKPDSGSITIDGTSITELEGPGLYEAVRNMGMLFQGSALFDSMNVEENVGFAIAQQGERTKDREYTKRELQQMVAQALEMVGLEGIQHKMPSELSGGMRRRVALARLIIYRPTFLFYDEPTTGLDPITAMAINQLIVKTQEELQATSVVVTHDLLCALHVGDRLALHEDGRIIYIAEPALFLEIDHPIISFLKRTITQNPTTFRKRTTKGAS
jgi:phospholipid/cholesterol/gamma-HCH transport system ATP-binding protein